MSEARELQPEPTCGTEPPFDPEGCGHDHHGTLICGEIVNTSWSGAGPEPVYCEHIDRRYARWLERTFLAAPVPPPALDAETLSVILGEWPGGLDVGGDRLGFCTWLAARLWGGE